jgi:hypothetical protein
MLDKYYVILGITEKANLSEIKKAFRARAKELHPDINKSPNVHEEFILLVEAYEYLVNLKTGKVYEKKATTTRRYQTYERWQDNEAARARHRAEYYSKVNYEEFSNSDYYKTITSLNTIFGHLGFFLAIGIFIPLPIILTLTHGASGFFISLLAMFITLPVTVDAIKTRPPINLGEFFRAVLFVVKTKAVFITALSIFNLFVIVKVGFQTLIPFYSLLLIFALMIALSFLFTIFILKRNIKSASLISFCYCPLAINFLFLINFLFTSNPTFETYSFVHEKRWYGGRTTPSRLEKIAYIDLENNKYDNFEGLRMFADLDAMKDAHKITYTFEDGLLGFRVMKDFQFDR